MIPKLYNGKNRTFFSYNTKAGARSRTSRPPDGFQPTRWKAGDFSSLLQRTQGVVTIYDPLTGVPFANNIIPSSRINSGAQNLMKYLIEPQFQQADPLSYTNRVNLVQHDFAKRLVHAIRSQFQLQGPRLPSPGLGSPELGRADHQSEFRRDVL